jgi:hypothetical protein
MILMKSPGYRVVGGDRPVIYSIVPKHSRTNPETMLPALSHTWSSWFWKVGDPGLKEDKT